jgi:asparagine synthase (glutamine-hydrolysing)
MSGVVGYWGYSSQDLTEAVFAAFTHSLAHRGPDGFGIEHFPEARLWLGHRRLAIVDLSVRGRQPMSYAEGRYWLTYNGEVYNYLEVREELRGLGHRFVSDSDSEVILAAYAQWGPECQLRFNGMWAFAIWDAQERRLFLSRDRFGLKPLLYSNHAGAFVFASELKAFLSLPWIDGAFDPESLADTLANIKEQEASPYTLLPGVRRLLAGHAMSVEANGRMRINAWWNTLDHLPRLPANLDEQVEGFRALFFDACRLRLRSAVPFGIEQSGGLDSSAIACTVASLTRNSTSQDSQKSPQRAFVASFPGTPYDESEYARIVINDTGMLPYFENIDDNQALKHIEQVIFDHEIIWGFPRVASWILYRAMRRNGVRMALSGMGADSLFGSDPDDIEVELEAAAARFDFRRYQDLRRILSGANEGAVGETRGLIKLLLIWLNLLEPLRAARGRLRVPQSTQRDACYNRDIQLATRMVGARTSSGIRSQIDAQTCDPRIKDMSPSRAYHYRDFHFGVLSLLAKPDRASMAHGIEARMPFMDWRLVAYVFALPENSRNGGGYSKRLLRLAMDGLVPDTVRLNINKTPFVGPRNEWAHGALKPWLLDLCASRSFQECAAWDGSLVRKIVEQGLRAELSLLPVWPFLQAYVLQREFVARASVRPGTNRIVSVDQ